MSARQAEQSHGSDIEWSEAEDDDSMNQESTRRIADYSGMDVDEEDSEDEFLPGQGDNEGRARRSTSLILTARPSHAGGDDDIEWSDDEDDDDTQWGKDFEKIGDKPKREKRAFTRHLEPHVKSLIDEARASYIEKEYDVAIALLHEAISADKNAQEAYKILATIYLDQRLIEKAIAAKIYAAYCNYQDTRTWIDAAELSQEYGQLDQADHLYAGAYKSDRSLHWIPVRRMEILLQLDRPAKALKLALRYRRVVFPHITDYSLKSRTLLCTAQAMAALDRRNEAIAMYEKLLQENLSRDPKSRDRSNSTSSTNGESVSNNNAPPDAEFGFQELSVLVELYYTQHTFTKAIKTIKKITRWLRGRAEETWWDDIKDDSEYDDRRFKVKKFLKTAHSENPDKYKLPPDLRARLLLCRLHVDKDFTEALIQVDLIKELEPEKYHDLYILVGRALLEKNQNQSALDLLQTAERYVTDAKSLELRYYIAKCRQALCQYDEAERLYFEVLQKMPDNIDVLVAVAEVFTATGKMEQARALIKRVNALRSAENDVQVLHRQREQDVLATHDLGDTSTSAITSVTDTQFTDQSFFFPEKERAAKRLTRAQKQQRERDQTIIAQDKWHQLLKFKSGVLADNPVSISEWLRLSDELISMFTAQKRFFVKTIIFQGGRGTIEERLERLATSVNQEYSDDDDEDEDGEGLEAEQADGETLDDEGTMAKVSFATATAATSRFRTILFSDWFDLFMEAALLRAKCNQVSRSYDIIAHAKSCRLRAFTGRTRIINLVHGSCAYIADDATSANEAARVFGNTYQFYNDSNRLYGALLASGRNSTDLFNAASNQKFYLRQIKAMDSVLQKKPIAGAARVVDRNIGFTDPLPLVLVTYAHIMLLGRSYIPCLTHIMRAHELVPRDPMILFTIGLVHAHRAIQRQSSNRHLQIVEGLSYLLEYHKIQSSRGPGHSQEADYNMGRLFQMLSLPTFAIFYYKKVIAYKHVDSTTSTNNNNNKIPHAYDLSAEAAYNLSLLYTLSGNPEAARAVIDENIVI